MFFAEPSEQGGWDIIERPGDRKWCHAEDEILAAGIVEALKSRFENTEEQGGWWVPSGRWKFVSRAEVEGVMRRKEPEDDQPN